jgi:hypothetical protein
MFETIRKRWTEDGLEILVVIGLCILLAVLLVNKNKKGSYSTYLNLPLHMLIPRNLFGYKSNLPSLPPIQAPAQQGKDSKQEIEVRHLLERRFNKPFPKDRPSFLNNDVTKSNLELDCFCKELGLAVEVNGVQHYKYTPFFHRNHDQFRTQQYRDVMKRQKCKEVGITLVEIPHTAGLGAKLQTYLYSELSKHGY